MYNPIRQIGRYCNSKHKEPTLVIFYLGLPKNDPFTYLSSISFLILLRMKAPSTQPSIFYQLQWTPCLHPDLTSTSTSNFHIQTSIPKLQHLNIPTYSPHCQCTQNKDLNPTATTTFSIFQSLSQCFPATFFNVGGAHRPPSLYSPLF